MKLRTQIPAILAFTGTLILSNAALADGHRDDHHFPIHVDEHRGHVEDRRGVVWGHGDIHHFHDFDFHVWQGGHWVHDWHSNHFGWWWVVGGAWLFFNAPVYPYPDPYVPSTVIVQTAPAPAPAPVVAAPAPSYWYYCPSAQNYYPYVTQCPVSWEQVPSTPPPAPTAAAAPGVPPPGTPAPSASTDNW